MTNKKMQTIIELREEDYICENCKYFGCERSKNCETICDKWDISELVLEDLLEERKPYIP